MGLFDFLKKKSEINYANVENEGLRAVSMRFRGSQEDTVFVTTSRLCPMCSVYNRRVYSVFGRYKSFPLLPEFLYQAVCPTCGCHIGYGHYFPSVNGNLSKDIKNSNKPFVDSRTKEEKRIWQEHIEAQQLNEKATRDYEWICANLPGIAPKSLGGYKRMMNSNSKNFQNLVAKAKEQGYTIKYKS